MRRAPSSTPFLRKLWIALALIVGAGPLMTACGTTSSNKPPALRRPTIEISFAELSEEERQVLLSWIQRSEKHRLDCTSKKERIICNPVMEEGREWTPTEIFDYAKELHIFVAGIRNTSGSWLAQSESMDLQLNYTTTSAQAVTGAVIFITPTPKGSQIFIDSKIPGLSKTRNPDGSQRLSKEGQFSLNLPFSFIRQHQFLYFHCDYQGATRYFFYDLERERQSEVGGIGSPEDWDYFKLNHKLP